MRRQIADIQQRFSVSGVGEATAGIARVASANREAADARISEERKVAAEAKASADAQARALAQIAVARAAADRAATASVRDRDTALRAATTSEARAAELARRAAASPDNAKLQSRAASATEDAAVKRAIAVAKANVAAEKEGALAALKAQEDAAKESVATAREAQQERERAVERSLARIEADERELANEIRQIEQRKVRDHEAAERERVSISERATARLAALQAAADRVSGATLTGIGVAGRGAFAASRFAGVGLLNTGLRATTLSLAAATTAMRTFSNVGLFAVNQIYTRTMQFAGLLTTVSGRVLALGRQLTGLARNYAVRIAVTTTGATAAIGAGAVRSTNNAGNIVAETAKGAMAAGMSTEEFSVLATAARSLNMDFNDLNSSAVQFRGQIAAAMRDPNSDIGRYFTRLGIALDASKPSFQLMQEAYKAADRLNGFERIEFLSRIFGEDDAAKLMPLFELLRDPTYLENLRDTKQALGTLITPEDVARQREYAMQQAIMREAWEGLQMQIGRYLMPTVGAAITDLSRLFAAFGPQLAMTFANVVRGGMRVVYDVLFFSMGRGTPFGNTWIKALYEGFQQVVTWAGAAYRFVYAVKALLVDGRLLPADEFPIIGATVRKFEEWKRYLEDWATWLQNYWKAFLAVLSGTNFQYQAREFPGLMWLQQARTDLLKFRDDVVAVWTDITRTWSGDTGFRATALGATLEPFIIGLRQVYDVVIALGRDLSALWQGQQATAFPVLNTIVERFSQVEAFVTERLIPAVKRAGEWFEWLIGPIKRLAEYVTGEDILTIGILAALLSASLIVRAVSAGVRGLIFLFGKLKDAMSFVGLGAAGGAAAGVAAGAAVAGGVGATAAAASGLSAVGSAAAAATPQVAGLASRFEVLVGWLQRAASLTGGALFAGGVVNAGMQLADPNSGIRKDIAGFGSAISGAADRVYQGIAAAGNVLESYVGNPFGVNGFANGASLGNLFGRPDSSFRDRFENAAAMRSQALANAGLIEASQIYRPDLRSLGMPSAPFEARGPVRTGLGVEYEVGVNGTREVSNKKLVGALQLIGPNSRSVEVTGDLAEVEAFVRAGRFSF